MPGPGVASQADSRRACPLPVDTRRTTVARRTGDTYGHRTCQHAPRPDDALSDSDRERDTENRQPKSAHTAILARWSRTLCARRTASPRHTEPAFRDGRRQVRTRVFWDAFKAAKQAS